MTRDTYTFLKNLRKKMTMHYPITFEKELKELNKIISDYEQSERSRDGINESLAECV